MANRDLAVLGVRLAELRIARQMKQTELAYEAGVSHRTLQRMEAGEAVKSDGLIKVIKCLERLEALMGALDVPAFSPYERLADAGLKVSQLNKQRNVAGGAEVPGAGTGESMPGTRKRRVRRASGARPETGKSSRGVSKTVKVQWPEDQQ